MLDVTVPFRGNHLTMSLDEAHQLMADLRVAVVEAKHTASNLQPPVLTPDRYLQFDSVVDFFRQIYRSDDKLRNNAVRLYGVLVEAAALPHSHIVALCPLCHITTKSMSGKCPVDRKVFHAHSRMMRISPDSLKMHLDEIIAAGHRGMGPHAVADLKILVNHLPE